MNNKSLKAFAYGQIVLGIALFVCLIIIPRYFFSLNQGGVSNFGTEDKTQLLFSAGFTVASLGTLLAAKNIKNNLKLRNMLIILGMLYLAVMLTTFPYKINEFYRMLHEKSAIVLFVFMLIFAIWIRFFRLKNNSEIKTWFIIFSLGTGLAALTLLGLIHMLFTAQIISAISFAMIVVLALKSK